MAVVSFDMKELEELVGKKLNKDVLENKVPMMGCEFEGVENRKVNYEVFPDRPDLLSVEGFARALRYFLGVEEGLENYEVGKSGIELKVEDSVDPVRPCISAGVVRNVQLDESVLKSIMQVQEKIHKTFGRGRKKIAIGIHDLDKVEEPFTYKGVDPESIEFVPLQSDKRMDLREIGEKHPKGKYVDILEGNEKWPVIVDKNEEVLSFPPVINGQLTELSEETENIFIDVTGTDGKAVEEALNIIVTSLADRGGGIETVTVNGGQRPDLDPKEMEVDLGYVNKLLGLNLKEGEFEDLIGGMGFGYSEGKVLVPPYRVDVMHPMDVVEDVAISHGYENLKPEIPDVPGTGRSQRIEDLTEKVKEVMLGFGFQEVKTTVLTNKERQFEKMERNLEEAVEMKNSFSENYNICRKYLTPELLEVLRQNQHRSYPQKIFEIGDVLLLDDEEETKTRNKRKASGLICNDEVNYVDLASVVSSILQLLDRKVKFEEYDSGSYLKNRASRIVVDGEKIGEVGEVHPEVLENCRIEKPVVAFELGLESLGK
ncbi:MAG: phenylalanine--tRNA ligase subunit beta [Candidatus Aenigmatarchaeota archaeon]